jgi:hypothetical protein
LPYVGALASDEQVILATGPESLESFAQRLKQEHLAAIESDGPRAFQKITITYKGEKETYYSYCRIHRVHQYGKQRLVTNLFVSPSGLIAL